MSNTLSRFVRFSGAKRVILAATLAVVGLGSFAGAASATFTLSTGSIQLTDGATTGNPPAGSWVSLPTDDTSLPTPYFQNPSSTWSGTPAQLFTVIRKGIAAGGNAPGLALGALQSGANDILGDTTDPFNRNAWYLYTRTTRPTLTFNGAASTRTSRTLLAGNLSGLYVKYAGNDYDVSTTQASGGNHTVPLTATIVGDATVSGRATITLNWTTDLTDPLTGFEPYKARFQLVGTYVF